MLTHLLSPGGKIDWAHHYGAADLALGEAIAMADAVEIADKLTSDQDTLIIVTADHSHTMSIAGYPQRGNPILGIVMYDFVMSKPILGIVMYDSVLSKTSFRYCNVRFRHVKNQF